MWEGQATFHVRGNGWHVAKSKGRLEEIADAIKAGQDPAEFEAELDDLLGTGLKERDPEVEERWERSRPKPPSP